MSISTANKDFLVSLYVGYFKRAPDPAGLDFWIRQVEGGRALNTIAKDFAASDEAHALYPYLVTPSLAKASTFVSSIYQNLFNRAPDAAGLEFWSDMLTSGKVAAGDMIDAIIKGAQNTDEGQDKTIMANKVSVGTAWVEDAANTTGFVYNAAAAKSAVSILSGVTADEQSVTDALQSIEDGTVNVPVGEDFVLTTGTDNLTGTAGGDTFTAGESAAAATFTVGDKINGGAGADTLNWVQTAAITGVPTAAVLTGIETVNVTSGAAITLNTTTGFADTTALNTNTSGAAQTITAAATHNLVVTAGLQAANAVAVNGGNDVTINATGVTTGTTTVGATTAAAGNVAVNVTNSTGGTTTGAIAVTGGDTVTVTSKAANAVNTTVVQSAVTVTGNAETSAVTVTQDATVAAAATVVGKTAGAVTVNDVNAGSTTAAGTIATVSLSSYGNSTIDSSALTTVNLSGTGGTLGISRGGLTATPTENTLNLNVNGLTAGAITDAEAGADDGFKTINLASSGTASTIADLVAADATAMTISGDAKVTLTAQTISNVKTITVTNTGGASLGTALATDVQFVGGAGADAISIGATTKAINMGGGDDVVTLSSATLGGGGSLSGGDGKDTLVANTNGSSFIADPAFGAFEVLRVAGGAAQGSHNANGFTALEIGTTAAAASFTSVAAGVGLTVLAGPTGGTTVTLANATGTSDSFNLALTSDANLTAGSVTVAGVETINITNTDSLTTAASGINANTLTLVGTAAKTVVVTGNAGLDLTNTGNVAITTFDASGITGAAADAAALAVTFISANTAVGENVTIKGGSGNDALTGTVTANDSIFGGDGTDTLVYTGGADAFTGGAGIDTYDVNLAGTKTAYLTVGDAAKSDKIDFVGISAGTIANATLGAKVTLGAAATLDQYLDGAAAGDGGTNALVKWFQYGSDTYVVLDNSAGGAFVSATDAVVKLAGVIDLSTSTLTSEVLTLV